MCVSNYLSSGAFLIYSQTVKLLVQKSHNSTAPQSTANPCPKNSSRQLTRRKRLAAGEIVPSGYDESKGPSLDSNPLTLSNKSDTDISKTMLAKPENLSVSTAVGDKENMSLNPTKKGKKYGE